MYNLYNMVRGGTINKEESHNDTQSMISTLGHTTKNRHHNRSRRARREIQQQQALGEPKLNAWAPAETPTNDDEVRESDNYISPGPESSDSENDNESESDSEKRDNVKSKAMHARDHRKREEEKKKKKVGAKLKRQQSKAIASADATLATWNTDPTTTAEETTGTATPYEPTHGNTTAKRRPP
jgi:hypothetical protein